MKCGSCSKDVIGIGSRILIWAGETGRTRLVAKASCLCEACSEWPLTGPATIFFEIGPVVGSEVEAQMVVTKAIQKSRQEGYFWSALALQRLADAEAIGSYCRPLLGRDRRFASIRPAASSARQCG